MQNMKRFCSAVLVCSLFSVGTVAQRAIIKTPVSVSRTGNDEVGSLLVAAITQELSKSPRYELMHGEPASDSAKLGLKVSGGPKEKGLEFFVELATADVAPNEHQRGTSSAISIVIESMGLPNSWPVPSMWYHKIVITNRQTVNAIAKQFVIDMDAHWCNTIMNSTGACPEEQWK